MNSYASLKIYKVFDRVGYYSLKSDDLDLTEAGDFFKRMRLIPEVADYLQRLVYWITQIGARGIDERRHFRHEGVCKALPPNKEFTNEENELRLYCHIQSNNVVILFNGDRKTPGAVTSQQCPNVEPHRLRAERWTSKLQKEDILTSGNLIINTDDIIIIY